MVPHHLPRHGVASRPSLPSRLGLLLFRWHRSQCYLELHPSVLHSSITYDPTRRLGVVSEVVLRASPDLASCSGDKWGSQICWLTLPQNPDHQGYPEGCMPSPLCFHGRFAKAMVHPSFARCKFCAFCLSA